MNVYTTCFLPCEICKQQARKCHNMNSFQSSICWQHVLWHWKCHVLQLSFERLMVLRFIRLPCLGEWWQYKNRKALVVVLGIHFKSKFPVDIALFSRCCASASSCIPIIVLHFFLAFWDVVWAAGDQELMGWMGMRTFTAGKMKHCERTGRICFSSAEVPQYICPNFVTPRRKMCPLIHEITAE